MRLKVLQEEEFIVAGSVDGEECPAEDFITQGEKNTEASRIGLQKILAHVAKEGLDQIPRAWSHEANKENKIYEFIKGRLRLFYFKGSNGVVVICTGGTLKDSPKADEKHINKAIALKNEYFQAVANGKISLERDDENN